MVYNNHEETIIAQCTPRGSGAIALIRLSGVNTFEVAEKITKLPKNKFLKDLPTHTIHFGWIKDQNKQFLKKSGTENFLKTDNLASNILSDINSNSLSSNISQSRSDNIPQDSTNILSNTNSNSLPSNISQSSTEEISQDSKNILVDQVMIIIMRGPNSFTGQDTIEITCHNNQFIIEEIINLAIKAGARYAQEGEFAQRAFLNKKIDLLQAEAINDLINSQTQLALKKSLAQLEGSFSHWIEQVEQELLKIFSWCEASFEFVEEVPEFGDKIKTNLNNLVKKISNIKATFDINKQVRQGIKISLIGAVNAGKSSLLNLLLGQKRAIVSNIPGTTRDTIEALISQGGNNLTLIDTAGIRQTKNLIEKEGVTRSFEEAQKADIILLIFDGSRALTGQETELYKEILEKYQNKIILIQNKSDLKESPKNLEFFNKFYQEIKLLKISSKQEINLSKDLKEISLSKNLLEETASNSLQERNGIGFPQESISPNFINISHVSQNLHKTSLSKESNNFNEIIFKEINQKISSLFSNLDTPFLLNERQYKILVKLEQDLENILNMFSKNVQYELISIHLQDSLEQISQLTGKTVKNEALNKIFKEFCIGK
jgi:tRNA modification GTPase TrmE